MISHDEQARELLQKVVEVGVKNPKLDVTSLLFLRTHSNVEERFDSITSRVLSGFGTEETSKALQEALGDSQIILYISPGLAAGDPAPSVFKTSDESKVRLDFVEGDDKVYLLVFDASWPNFQEFIAHIQEMLEHHPEWEGRVEIVPLSPDTLQVANKERGWVEHTLISAPKDYESSPSQLYTIQEIPTCFLVHNGKIAWRGEPSSRNFEQDISDLIAGGPIASGQGEEAFLDDFNEEELNEKKIAVKHLLKNFKEGLPEETALHFRYARTKTFKTEGKPTATTKCSVQGFLHKKYSERVDAFVRDIKALFPEAETEDTTIKFATYSVARAAACSKCGRALTEDDVQYVSLVEPGYTLCEECEATPGEGQGSYRLAHPYSLYRVHPQAQHLEDLLYSVEEVGIDQIYEEDPEDLTHMARCRYGRTEGCGEEIVGVRWRCAHCQDYDLCDACHTQLITDSSEEMLKIATFREHFPWHICIKHPFPNEQFI
mmetsp:Transcript_12733/g.23728  ORF Transcript_12733/g.23728 Transcript_12733/m.23728 type:complete len:489 (+) Transcript_12733:60-1526(+)